MDTLTDQFVLAAYVEGSDLEEVASGFRSEFVQFVDSGCWPTSQVLAVDQRQPPDLTEPEFLPQWDLGLNLGLDHVAKSPDWFGAIESLVSLLQKLAARTGREFVLFVCFRDESSRQEHLAFVADGAVDLVWLRDAIVRLTRR